MGLCSIEGCILTDVSGTDVADTDVVDDTDAELCDADGCDVAASSSFLFRCSEG